MPTASYARDRSDGGWTSEQLDAARLVADPHTDAVAARVLDPAHPLPQDTRLGYNRLLDLADRLLEEPELYLLKTSHLRTELDAMDPALVDFFDPQPLPAWVDEAMLAKAGSVWNQHALAIICVLYAASLPSCYLMAKGIPVLYATRKLGEPRFIFQRIYETGLMLDAAMRSHGLRISTDMPAGAVGERLTEEVRRRQPHAQWAWNGDLLAASSGNAKIDQASVATVVRNTIEAAPRYVWGAGVIASRKVRFLHASMRYYLRNPRPAREGSPLNSGEALSRAGGTEYDLALNGEPVNQEDLAFTLLTFGYVIPEGLARWGIVLDAEEREAFWHRWRLIGHLMGVREDLVPTSYQQAGVLYGLILARQKGASDMGQTLAMNLLGFFGDYLPSGLRPHLPALLIQTQLGANADLILPHLPTPYWMRMAYQYLALPALIIANRVRRSFMRFTPVIGWLEPVIHHAGQALIDSWKDGYDRRPFYVPDSEAGGWRRLAGADPAYLERLQDWRTHLFLAACSGLAGLILGTLVLLVALPLVFWPVLAGVAGSVGAFCIVMGVLSLSFYVPLLARMRPRREDERSSLHHPLHPLARPEAIVTERMDPLRRSTH